MSDASMSESPEAPLYRPLSALAVTALVLAILFSLVGIVGLWWLQALPVLLCVVAWSAISAGRRRGTGLAIAATVVGLLGGIASFGCAQAVRAALSRGLTPLVTALVKDDREALARWATREPDLGPRADAWKKRMEAARERVGAWREKAEVGGSIWLPYWFIVTPSDLVEVEPKGDGEVPYVGAFWVRAECERGDLWIALLPAHGKDAGKGLQEMAKNADKTGDKGKDEPHVVDEVRVFVTAGSGGK